MEEVKEDGQSNGSEIFAAGPATATLNACFFTED